ncbi:MAG: MBL fold metallo-hydrolase [Bacteroidales bacterium]|nr:MBL fold metallo-hydrolase [Bacteroidales bacterium]
MQGGIAAWTEAGKPVSRYACETFLTPGGRPVTLTLIKHGSLEIRFAGRSIQIDPVSGLGRPTDYAMEFPKADLVLVTHEHGDHLDPVALASLCGEGTHLISNETSAERLRGVEGIVPPEVMANGERRIIVTGGPRVESSTLPEDLIVEAVPAYNTTPGREKFHPAGNGNGYVLTLDGLRIYVAGDTEDIPEMAELKEIDIALLPCNQPYTMTVEQCVRAAEAVRPKVLIPYHFGETDITSLPGRLPGIQVLLREMQ